jgi:hypothetical protein
MDSVRRGKAHPYKGGIEVITQQFNILNQSRHARGFHGVLSEVKMKLQLLNLELAEFFSVNTGCTLQSSA